MFVRSQVAFHGFPISVALKKIGAIGKQEQLSDRLAEADAFVPPDPATCLGHAHLGVDYFLQMQPEPNMVRDPAGRKSCHALAVGIC